MAVASAQNPASTPQRPRPAGDPATVPEQKATESTLAAALLAVTGGSLDAFLYLNHGHVFAGAMTGNAVLCGIALLGDDHAEAIRHALPILSFVLGIWLSELLQTHARQHAASLALIVEIAGLCAASFVPASFPDLAFVPLLSLMAALQIGSFRKVDRFPYNSTFITGNLRTVIVSLYCSARAGIRSPELAQARDLGIVTAAFLAGATAGAFFSPRLGNHMLWLPSALLFLVLVMAVRRSRRPRETGAAALH